MFDRTASLLGGVALIFVSGALAANLAAQGGTAPKTQGTKPTLGTSQMPGDNGKVGTIYQLGAKGVELHFTLNSATVATRYRTVDRNLIAGKNERLLILNYTVHNPLKIEQMADPRAFKFTVVSPDDKNVEFSGSVYEPDKRTAISQMLKPAQKVKLSAVIPIFAQGPITKLIVARGAGTVLRYNLQDALVKSTSVFATDGVSIGDDAVAELGKPFDHGGFDLEVQEVAESAEAIGAYTPSASSGVYFVTVKFSNPLIKPLSVGWQYFTPALTDENGEALHWVSDLVSASSGKSFSQEVDADSSVRAKYIFTGPKGVKPAKLKLTLNAVGRSATIKLP